MGYPAVIATSLNNIGSVYQQQEKWEQAIERYEKALGLYEHLGRGFESKVADHLEALAICYAKWGDLEKGRPYYERARQMGRFRGG